MEPDLYEAATYLVIKICFDEEVRAKCRRLARVRTLSAEPLLPLRA